MAIGKQPDVAADDVGMDDGGGESIFAEINITPLTDVFLVMVIIFMVSALAVQAEQNQQRREEKKKQEQELADKKSGLNINLPQGKAKDIDENKPSLVLEIPLSGDVQIGPKHFTNEELDQLFAGAYQRDKGTQVILKADKGVQHGRVVDLMERAKQAGLTHLAIGTGAGK
jgi:biopolymer transport protein ExbD